MCLHTLYFKTNMPLGMQTLHMHSLVAQKGCSVRQRRLHHSEVTEMTNNTRAPLYPEPETVLSLYFPHSAPHQIHVGSLGGCFWAEMNKSAIFLVFYFFLLPQLQENRSYGPKVS